MKASNLVLSITLGILTLNSAGTRPALASTTETAAERDKRMEWFRDARFGMFIHWGLYAIPAGEWKGKTDHAEWIRHTAKIPLEEYNQFLAQFNPVKFDPAQWAKLARGAGMKYLVITSKHHDGFALWDSKVSDFDVMSTPFKRDILKELERACRREGIRFCTYHSIMDWHHPDYLPRREWEKDRSAAGADFDRFRGFLKAQLAEIVKAYRPGILWFDGEWENTWTHEMGVDLYDYMRGLDPKILINNRVDKGRSGMAGLTKSAEFRGDFGTPEQEIPAKGLPGVDWESCMTMNDHWGWNKADKNWKSTEDLIRKLIDIASKGGNFLLNIGPKADGTFPDEAIERLEGIGRWMDQNKESIYESQASPFGKLAWGRCTQKVEGGNTTVFLHVFNWPSDGKLVVRGLRSKPASANLLAGGNRLPAELTAEGLLISVPSSAPDPVSSTIVLKIKGPVQVQEVGLTQDYDGSAVLHASEARLHGKEIQYESGHERDNIGYWTNPDEWVDWELTVTKPGRFEVSAEMAAPEPASLEVASGNSKLTAPGIVTRDYGKFRLAKLGVLELPHIGKVTISVRPVKEGWHAINLKALRLKPAAGQ